MRVRIQPRMLVYAVYLVEHEYHPQGHPEGQCYLEGQDEQPPPYTPTDNTVHDDPNQPLHLTDLQTNITEQETNIVEREAEIAEREMYNQGTVNLL